MDFIPEFAGKLNFYVSAADELLKGEDDNPSIGLLLCKSSDKTMVEWSLRDIQKPLGVATYQLQEVVERTVRELGGRRKTEKLIKIRNKYNINVTIMSDYFESNTPSYGGLRKSGLHTGPRPQKKEEKKVTTNSSSNPAPSSRAYA